jgi:hypothetical protein
MLKRPCNKSYFQESKTRANQRPVLQSNRRCSELSTFSIPIRVVENLKKRTERGQAQASSDEEMDNGGRTTRGSKRRASAGGGGDETARDGIGRRSRSSSPKMETRKRKHPSSDLLDTRNGSELAVKDSKNASVQPMCSGISNGCFQGENGSSKNDNGSSRHYTRSRNSDTPEEENISSTRRRKRVSLLLAVSSL